MTNALSATLFHFHSTASCSEATRFGHEPKVQKAFFQRLLPSVVVIAVHFHHLDRHEFKVSLRINYSRTHTILR